MGLLLERRTCRMVALAARSVLGRSPTCQVFADDPRASAEHAVIAWMGAHWELRDLGSLNGTWCDGRRLDAGERVALARDATLGVGGPDAAWILADASAAAPTARNEVTGELVYGAGELLAVPSADDPRATVFRDAALGWRIELRGELSAIEDGARIELDGERWTLGLPALVTALPDTVRAGGPRALGTSCLALRPSTDEEHVDVRVQTPDGAVVAVPDRASHYMVLTLARARLADARAGVAAEHQGWLYASALAEMLRWGPERLNLEVFRTRALFAKLGFVDAAALIERRASSRQLRIGMARLEVTR